MGRDEVFEMVAEEALKADGFDDCIIGVVGRCGMLDLLLYDTNKIIEKLMREDGMSYEDAVEHFNFNIRGAYMGDGTPLFAELIDEV